MSEIPIPVRIFDTTLRDGAQSPGISLSTDQSLAIAHQLNRLGVDVIEAGFPISSPGNFLAVQAIARQVQGPIIAGLARAKPDDIRSAAEAVRDAERPRIHTFISTSDIHIQNNMVGGNTRADVVRGTRAAVADAKSYVNDVEFSPMDATRTAVEFVAEVCQAAIEEGATTINIPDTVGYTQPDEYKAYLRKLYELVPALGGVVLSVHCHDDLGLAVANSFAGVQAGARQVECAVNGLGERAGNAALEEIVMLLRTRRQRDGYDTGINTALLGPTSQMVARYTGYEVPRNKAIVGKNAFQHESGIHQDGILKQRETFEIMSAASVGMDAQSIVLGKQSGRKAVKKVLENEGVFQPEHLRATFGLFKDLADKVGGISPQQIVEIQDEAIRRQTANHHFHSYEMHVSGRGSYAAKVTLSDRRETRKQPKTVTAKNDLDHPDIDGPISALFTALGEATGTDYALESYQVDSIGSGKQTIGKALVILRLNGKTITGHGLSLDTTKAAAWAYLDAIGKANEAQH